MKLIEPNETGSWRVSVQTENGSIRIADTGCASRREAEQLVQRAKVAELEAASKALRLTAEVVTLITANRHLSVSDAISEWNEWLKVSSRSERTRTNSVGTVQQWARETLAHHKSIGTVSTAELNEWVNPADTPIKRGTRQCRLAALRSFFRYCGIKRYILSDPTLLLAVDYRRMTHTQRETQHKAVFDDHAIELLLNRSAGAEPPSVTPGFFRVAIILGRDLGLRLGDISLLEWASLDLARGEATIWTEKSNRRVVVPMTQRVLDLLAQLRRTHPQYLFPNERDVILDPSRRASLSVAFGRFFNRCGFSGYSFHSLRASYATSMADRGVPILEIGRALGHSCTSTTRVYLRHAGVNGE